MFKTAQDGFDFSVGDFIVIAPPKASQNGRQDGSKSVALDALGGLPEITQDMPTGFKMVGRAERQEEFTIRIHSTWMPTRVAAHFLDSSR